MMCKKRKLSLVTGVDGNFRLSGDCFSSTEALPSKQSPSRLENPICTGYWWKILIVMFSYRESRSMVECFFTYIHLDLFRLHPSRCNSIVFHSDKLGFEVFYFGLTIDVLLIFYRYAVHNCKVGFTLKKVMSVLDIVYGV